MSRVRCMVCRVTLSPGSEPASDGLGPCCWAAYRAKNGLRPRPYPLTANRSECPDVPSPGSRRPGDVAPALILDGGRSADKRCVSTPNAARAGGRNATPAQHPGGEIGASGPSIPPRGAIPANPTPQLPPAECSDRRASSEGPAPSFDEVSA